MVQRIAGVEFARLSSLYRYGVIDTPSEPAIDHVLERLAARLDAPVVQLVFADAQRYRVKSGIGLGETLHLRGRGPLETLIDGGPDFLSLRGPFEGLPPDAGSMRSLAAVRIVGLDDEVLGALYVADARERDFPADAHQALAAAAAEIRVLLDSGRRLREDEATGALARDAFLDQANRLMEVTRLGRQWISLVTFDMAPLRTALEAKATGLGTLAMRLMADLGQTQVRRRDSFGRFDDDLFGLLLTDTGEAGARVLALRLSRHLERGWTDAGLATTGVDLGIASAKPQIHDDIAALLSRAQAAPCRFDAASAAAAPMSRVA